MHVLIIGGGTRRMCLAHGLRRAGVSVSVYERDRTRSDGLHGYRVGVDPTGNRALSSVCRRSCSTARRRGGQHAGSVGPALQRGGQMRLPRVKPEQERTGWRMAGSVTAARSLASP
jgi:hypothetical protein